MDHCNLEEQRERADAWSRYWAAGAPHSCIGTYGARYGGAVAAFWKEVFGQLHGNARVLDIATGNGALPLLLLDACAEPGVTCDAFDVASVRLPWAGSVDAAQLARVRLHPGTDAAALPFPDGVFDLAVSQFGLEYTDLARSVPELLRVLSPDGRLALVIHHAEGRPVTLARIEVEELRWAHEESGWFEATAGMVEPMIRASTFAGRALLRDDRGAIAARERFDAVQAGLAARAGNREGADVLHDLREAAAAIFSLGVRDGAEAARAAIEGLRLELAAAATRLGDLVAHAKDHDAADALRRRLEAGMRKPLTLDTLVERGQHVMGWVIRG